MKLRPGEFVRVVGEGPFIHRVLEVDETIGVRLEGYAFREERSKLRRASRRELKQEAKRIYERATNLMALARELEELGKEVR